MASLALVIVCLSAGDVAEKMSLIETLPPADQCRINWETADNFAYSVDAWMELGGGEYKDRLLPMREDAKLLAEFWRLAWSARSPWGQCDWRFNYAREALIIHDWRVYGLPPTLPYWYFPVWDGNNGQAQKANNHRR